MKTWQATRLMVGLCNCPDVHIQLFGKDVDIPIAEAVVSADQAEGIARDLLEAAIQIRDRTGDTIGRTEGSA